MSQISPELREWIKNIQCGLNANLVLYSAEISDQYADALIQKVRSIPAKDRKETVVLILATFGGDPDAAYRITRFLKSQYKKFILFIFGYCKSAGTLIAIGADEIVMSDLAELGPLDIQISRQDDFRRSSGLDLNQALDEVTSRIYDVFEDCFLKTMYRGGGVISARTAGDIASTIAVGLLSPITAQIDPLRLGENSRQIQIAYDYGIRLNPKRDEMVSRLVSSYPSHSFVIDYEEAKELFGNVRQPQESEWQLEQCLYQCVRSPTSEAIIVDFTQLMNQHNLENTGEQEDENNQNNEQNSNSNTANSRESDRQNLERNEACITQTKN